MSMTWEEVAEERLREIRRLRGIVRVSTANSVIIECAVEAYNTSRKAFYDSRAMKADVDPMDLLEIRRMAEMRTIMDFIVALGLMSYEEFITFVGTEI